MTALEELELAERVIAKLLDVIEEQLPEYYSGSNVVLAANDWLKLRCFEPNEAELKEIKGTIETYC